MNKKRILIIIVVTTIALITAVGTIAFTFRDTTASTGDTNISDNIQNEGTIINPQFTGSVTVEATAYIYNSGVLDLQDLEIFIEVWFTGDINPNTQSKIGEKLNKLGDIPAGENVSKVVEIELTEQTAKLAVQNGEFLIKMDIAISVEYIPYTFEFQRDTTAEWNAPFSSMSATI